MEIQSELKSIGKFVFGECASIKKISFPSSVVYFDESAFYSCRSLSQLIFPDNPSLPIIGIHCFDNCSTIVEVQIPSSVTLISMHAFKDCVSLKKVSIPCSVAKIDICVLYRCSSLVQIEIPSSVNKIGVYPFWVYFTFTIFWEQYFLKLKLIIIFF